MKLFQQPVPAAGPEGTWMEMDRVFRLTDHPDR
jgi:L-rhamnose mutarotase